MDRIAEFTEADEADTPWGRQKKYERRVAEAIAHNRFWAMLWFELARDVNGTIANLLFRWRQVDVHFSGKL